MRCKESHVWKEDTLKNMIGILYWQSCEDCSHVNVSADGDYPNCGKVEMLQDGGDVVCANFNQTDMPPESMDKE
jgi:hypothetical protein